MAVLERPTQKRDLAALMSREVVLCFPEDSLAEAARKMWECDLGFLVVVPPGERRPLGVVTDRDLCMAAYTQGRPLSEIPVRVAMARQVHVVQADDRLEDVHTLMRETRVRRIPVVNGEGEVAGVVGLADLAREASPGALSETVRAITEPRQPPVA